MNGNADQLAGLGYRIETDEPSGTASVTGFGLATMLTLDQLEQLCGELLATHTERYDAYRGITPPATAQPGVSGAR